jgi:hypothetical protein
MTNSEDIAIDKPKRKNKPGQGRKKKPSTIIEEALNRVRVEELPGLLEVLIAKAKGGDRDSAIYLLDRVLGRPAQSIDNRVKVQLAYSADDYQAAIRDVKDAETKLLASGDAAPLTDTP